MKSISRFHISANFKKGLYWGLTLAGLWFMLWLRAYQPPNTVDDAYITFRYAQNLIQGIGFVYNADERVLGTTTPAYTLLLAVSALISGFHDFPRLALMVNAACDTLTFCLLIRLTARLTARRWLGLLAAWLFTLDARLLDFSTGGMESSFNLLSHVLVLTLFFHQRTSLTVVMAGLAVLIRPDGITLAVAVLAALGLPVWRTPKAWPWREAALLLAVVLPWLIFASAYFGQPIPQSVLAKSVVYRLEDGLPILAALLVAWPQLSRLNALPWEQAQRPRFILNSSFNKEREGDYVMVAQMLAPAAQAGRRVAIPEIGAFGYSYPSHIFDTTGLVTPAIHRYFPIPLEIPVYIYTIPSQMIFTERPDIFVTFDSFIAEDILRTPENVAEFQTRYTPSIGLVSRSTFPTQRLVVYRRADLPLEVDLPAGLRRIPVEFNGGRMWLEGYWAQFGQTPEYAYLEITLVWRNGPQQNEREVLAAVDLLDTAGAVRYQILNFPAEAFFPTSQWAPGQLIFDRHQLKLPTEGGGPYTVHVRLLDEPTGEPLPAQAVAGAQIVENAVIISELGR